MLNVQGTDAESYVYGMQQALPYRDSRRQGYRDRATRLAYGLMQRPTYSARSGLTMRAWLEQEVGQRMGVGWLSFILWPVIQAVISFLIDYWFRNPKALEAIRE